MTTRRIIISFFVLSALLPPVLGGEFVEQNVSAATAMVGCSLIIAFLFWSNQAVFLNVLIATYVFPTYLIRPYISVFEDSLSLPRSAFPTMGAPQYLPTLDPPGANAVVYWSLFSLLLAWSIGLLLFRSPSRDEPFSIPRLFTELDEVIARHDLPFFATITLIFVLNWTSPESGLRAGQTGEADPLFLLGLASLQTVSVACLYVFLRERHAGLRRPSYLLLFLPLVVVAQGLLVGSRGAAYYMMLWGFVYWLLLGYRQKWRPVALIKGVVASAALLVVGVGVGLFAQGLRSLYRYSSSVDPAAILQALNFDAVLNTGGVLQSGIAGLLYRLGQLKGQFYILNDWYIHEPWQHYNPATTVMRIINDLMPGKAFPDVLSINQLFDYIYFDELIIYNSQNWGIQSTLYLYFGHFGAPVIVLVLAIIAKRIYPWVERSMLASPALAAVVSLLILSFMTNGTLEKSIPVDVVRPLASFVIFILVYRSFSLILPTRIRFWTPTRSVRAIRPVGESTR